MGFAPLAFLRGPLPPRSITRTANPCSYADSQDRQFRIEYLTPTPDFPYSDRQVFAAPKAGRPHERSFHTPPPHYHFWQDEHFKVESGKGIWHLDGGVEVHLKAGDEISVPMWKYHWFETDPDTTEPLSVLVRFVEADTDMEVRFFKNILTYMDDCQKSGVALSLFQIQVFCMHNWMCIAMVNWGPPLFKFFVNAFLTILLGCVGEFLLGYQKSYPEYYQPQAEKKD